ncbi:MAG TPA: pyridoxamine 5'-phosphate oxidase family protein [Candidatus Eremiobacteraceae bacterium]|nr:pyridoxamine 5'-phosphate oxidase family protein [Candidatus Eremiobacteraceae bacterium]
MKKIEPTKRTRVVREPHRGVYDRESTYSILDEALVCHIGFVVDGQPYVIPTLFARIGDIVYFHGSAASRMLRQIGAGAPMSLTVTLVDGIVLARSVFNHSMNYRSVVVLGTATVVDDVDSKRDALAAFTDKLLKGRWGDARPPTENELAATSVLRLPLEEFSAKVRTGPPIDKDEDLALPVWAGVLPLRVVAGDPIPDAGCDPTSTPPRFDRFERV